MSSTGIRELRNNLSRYVRQVETGKRIAITAHGRVIAELVPPAKSMGSHRGSTYDELVRAGVIQPAAAVHTALPKWPDIHLPTGTAARLIDEDRGDS